MGLEDERKMLTGSGDPKERQDQEDMEPDLRSSGSIPEPSVGLTTAVDEKKKEEAEEEELVDPLTTVREQCEQLEKCVKARERLELCDARVSSRSHTEEDCTEELFDFLHARDHCVAHKLFNSLK